MKHAVYDPTEPDWHRAFRRQAIRDGMKRKAEAGGKPGCTPVGYRNRRDQDGTAYVEVDPVQGPLVREAFEMATEAWSVRRILKHLTTKGLRSRHDKELTAMSLYRILTNPFYCGKIRFNEQLLPGIHEITIEESTFWHVQRSMSCKRRTHERFS